METLVTFSLGVGTVLIIIGVVVGVKLVKQVRELVGQVADIQNATNQNEEIIHRRIDQEIDRVNTLHIDSISFTDSRVDKLEAKITNTQGSKQVLKG